MRRSISLHLLQTKAWCQSLVVRDADCSQRVTVTVFVDFGAAVVVAGAANLRIANKRRQRYGARRHTRQANSSEHHAGHLVVIQH